MPKERGARKERPAKLEPEVQLQVTVPPRIKRAVTLKSAETGRTLRALVLEGLRGVGVDVTDEEIAGRRGQRNK